MRKQSEKNLFCGRWITLKELTFRTKTNQLISWESIERKDTNIIIVIVPLIKPNDQYVLIKQFRPSINKLVLGFPAGILDLKKNIKHIKKSEIQTHALKELKEETGYNGKVIQISPKLAFNPALSNERVYIVNALIDFNEPKNTKPHQKLEPAEEIEVILVDKSKIKSYLENAAKKKIEIGAALWYLFCLEP